MFCFKSLLPDTDAPIGVYIHIPFCEVRCSYCDFATDLEREGQRDQFFRTLEIELEARVANKGLVADTIYLGGGTPSLLTIDELKILVTLLQRYFDLGDVREFTVEANPGGINPEILQRWAEIGIDRVSLGVQSFIEKELKTLGRAHLAEQNHSALVALSESGMRFNADLMIGTPGQSLVSVKNNLQNLINYGARHLSVYMLSVESGSPWFNSVQMGKIRVCDDEDVAQMYQLVIKTCAMHGIEQYEISAFSEPGAESLHNLKYWMNDITLGFGPSAASYSKKYRYQNYRSLEQWQKQWETEGLFASYERIHSKNAILETFMLQFRLIRGIAVKELDSAHEQYPELKIKDRINRLVSRGLLQLCEHGHRVGLSMEGRLFANEVFLEFVD